MFGRKKDREKRPQTSKPSAAGDEPLIVALLIDSPHFDLSAAQRKLVRKTLGSAPLDVTTEDGILSLKLDGEWAFITPMPVPYPASDIEGPCYTSWMWPPETPATSVLDHRSHVLVTLIKGAGSPIERRLRLTRLTAALAGVAGVVAVYWPDAALVHFPPIFMGMAESAAVEGPPLYLWVDFRVFKNDDGTSGLFTTGLAALGLMEIEIPHLDMPPGELREWAVNIAAYLLDRGQPLPHNDTIGASAEQQLKVRHGPSAFGTPGTVMSFE